LFVRLACACLAVIVAGSCADVDEPLPVPASPWPAPTRTGLPSARTPKSAPTDGLCGAGRIRPDCAGQPSALLPAEAERLIGARARCVVTALARRDMATLARLVHPDKGVRFSPYACVELENDQHFQGRSLTTLLADSEPRVWGSADGTGNPIRLRFREYFAAFVYDRDFVHAPDVAYNRTIQVGTMSSNLADAYPEALFVEYHFPASALELDWRSLRLVFEPKAGKWFLVGIVHDQWTI
jgi:hypothetical protein